MVDAQLNINLFDALVYLVMFFSALISLYRGFIREFLSLITWFGAGMITLALADNATAFMKQHMSSGLGAAVVGIMGTYFLVVITLGMLSRILLRYVKEGADVGWPDHFLGLGFGIIKGGLVVVLGFILMTLVFKQQGYPEWVQTAQTLPMVQSTTLTVVRMMPKYLGSISTLGEEGAEGMEGALTIDPNAPPPTQAELDAGIADAINSLPATDRSVGQPPVTMPVDARPTNSRVINPSVINPMPADPNAPPPPSPLEQLIQDVTKDRETVVEY